MDANLKRSIAIKREMTAGVPAKVKIPVREGKEPSLAIRQGKSPVMSTLCLGWSACCGCFDDASTHEMTT